jgi:ABC-type nitrate/sulfonate/bicarbonate transport system permease component
MESALTDTLFSLSRVAVGGALGALFGIFLATIRYALPRSVRSHPLVGLLFEFPRFPPPIAWLPFVVLFAGIGPLASVTVVFLAVFPPVLLHTYEGLGRIPLQIKRLAHSMELGAGKRFTQIYLPFLLPQLFTGVRIGLGMGWMAIIAAEMISGQNGLGYSIQLHRIYLEYDQMILDIALIGLVGFAFHVGLRRLERRFAPWAVESA